MPMGNQGMGNPGMVNPGMVNQGMVNSVMGQQVAGLNTTEDMSEIKRRIGNASVIIMILGGLAFLPGVFLLFFDNLSTGGPRRMPGGLGFLGAFLMSIFGGGLVLWTFSKNKGAINKGKCYAVSLGVMAGCTVFFYAIFCLMRAGL